MPRFVLDTNVISEIAKPVRNEAVPKVLDAATDAFVPVVTVHELEFGEKRLAPGAAAEQA